MRRAWVLAVLLFGSTVTSAVEPRLPRIGIVFVTVPLADAANPRPEHGAARAGPAIVEGLRERGWIDGRNVQLLWRSAEGDVRRLPGIMEELTRIPVDVLVVFGPGVEPAMKATSTIPIVMSTSGGIANVGMVKSLGRSGSNVTGVSFETPATLTGKKLELLKRAIPGISRVTILVEDLGIHREPPSLAPETEAAARQLGLSLRIMRFDPGRVADGFAKALAGGADAIVVGDGVKIYWRSIQAEFHALAERHRIPVIHSVTSAAETGGLMAYGFDIRVNYRRMPYFIDRILRGAKPSELPIEQPARMEFIVNKRAAKVIGLALPQSVVAQADKVFD